MRIIELNIKSFGCLSNMKITPINGINVFYGEDVDAAEAECDSGCFAEKLPGVNKVSVNAMTYKLIIDAEDDAFQGVVDQVVKLFADIEPDCEVLV